MYTYTSVLLSLYSDIRAADQKYCGTLQMFWPFLRRTLTLAAVLAVQLGVHLASNCRPGGQARHPQGHLSAQEAPSADQVHSMRPKLGQ